MGLCTNHMSKCKNQIVDSSLSTNMHKHIKKLWFAQRNIEFNCLMLNIHIHRMLQLRKCVRLLWLRHALCVQDWPLCSMVFWPPQSNKSTKLKTLTHPNRLTELKTTHKPIFDIYKFHDLFTLISLT